MKHIFEQTVYYADTDAYGVVWHGTYLRWMECARVEFCRELGIDLVSMKENDVVIPVTNLNIRYKASAKLDEQIIVETRITKISPLTVTFTQTIKNKITDKIYTIAEVEVVAVNSEGKIYRRMPELLKIACQKGMAD
jgi:acyl-CoA thioester hydrolase